MIIVPGSTEDLIARWFLGGIAACAGEAVTFPLDFTKTRLQLQNELGKTLSGEIAKGKPLGMFGTAANIFRTEGLFAMYGGLSAAALRQFVYGGIGVGLYVPVRNMVLGDSDPKKAPLYKRILAGALSGSLGQLVANPFDVVKVRLQADGRLKALGQNPRYSGTLNALLRIPKEEGIGGFYKGLGPSIGRAAVINGCGIASYDWTKVQVLRLTGQEKGLVPQVIGSLVSGLVSALVSTPFDVIKTRMMNQPKGAKLYSNSFDCAVKTARAEGILGLYKGFLPAYSRLAPHRVVHFVTLFVASFIHPHPPCPHDVNLQKCAPFHSTHTAESNLTVLPGFQRCEINSNSIAATPTFSEKLLIYVKNINLTYKETPQAWLLRKGALFRPREYL